MAAASPAVSPPASCGRLLELTVELCGRLPFALLQRRAGRQHAMGKKAAGKDKQRPAITIPACSGLPEAATELQMAGGTGCWA